MVFRSRGLRQHLGAIERCAHVVGAKHVLERQWVRGRWHVVEIEGFDICRVSEDAAEFAGEVLDLVIGQRKPGEFCDVVNVGG